ncbi:hypothetical protein [Kitasatospora sp. NPDC005748]|uniref:hypothetical protein n=1 Tax=Kitasatospora sp. NPDC005748 TaxID=3157063 RepID=UPI0033F4BA6D
MTPAPDERARIRAAIDRILAGAPENSNGALTVVALAQEAGVPRNALTQRHPDLREDFYARVRTLGRIPDSEARLRKQIVKLKEMRAADARELRQLRADRQALVQVANQLTLENRRLHEALARLPGRIVAVPARPQLPLHDESWKAEAPATGAPPATGGR